MALDFRLPPSIESVSPLGEAVPLDAVVEVQFSTDLDRTVLAGALAMIDPQGHSVPGVLSYEGRALRFKPTLTLMPQTAYTVVIQGIESAGSPVIRSIVGVPMGKNESFSFRTMNASVTISPILLGPADASEVGQAVLTWGEVTGASSYWVQLFADPSLANIIWESRVVGTSVLPDQIPDGQYWWRIAATDAQGRHGPWSSVLTFRYSVAPPEIPIEPSLPPTFSFNERTLMTDPVYLLIKWPFPATVSSIKLIREDIDGLETEIEIEDEWTQNTLKITPVTGGA